MTYNISTFGGTSSWTANAKWDTRYLCHFSTKTAEIWSPGIFFQDVLAYKISALEKICLQTAIHFSHFG